MKRILLGLLMLSVLANAITISGRVTEARTDGSIGPGIPGAVVKAYLNDTLIATTTTDEHGSFVLDVDDHTGRYRITAEKDGYFPGGIEGIDVKSDYTLFSDDLTMFKIEYVNLSGVVTCDGQPVEGVNITAITLNAPNQEVKTTLSGPDGRYSLTLMKNIKYKITADKYGCKPYSMSGVYALGQEFDIRLVHDPDEVVVNNRPEPQNTTQGSNTSTGQGQTGSEVPEPENTGVNLYVVIGILVVILLVLVYLVFLRGRKR